MAMAHGLAMLLLPPVFMASTGCHGKDNSALKRESSHVRLLTNLHGMAASKLGHVPRDVQEFKQTIAKLNIPMERLKVASIDELFVSERDGLPLIVVYGSTPAVSDVVVYEQTGVNGKRQVGYRIGMVEEVDDAHYKELTSQLH